MSLDQGTNTNKWSLEKHVSDTGERWEKWRVGEEIPEQGEKSQLRVCKKCWELGIISGIGSNDHQKAEIHPSPLSPEWSMFAAVMTLFKPSLPYSRTYCMQQRSLASLSVIHGRFQNLSSAIQASRLLRFRFRTSDSLILADAILFKPWIIAESPRTLISVVSWRLNLQ